MRINKRKISFLITLTITISSITGGFPQVVTAAETPSADKITSTYETTSIAETPGVYKLTSIAEIPSADEYTDDLYDYNDEGYYSPVEEYLKSLEGKYSGGDGSKENPWKISTVEDLLFMRTDMDRDGSYGLYRHYFELTNDIVFNENYKNYKSWGKKAPKNKLDAPVDNRGCSYSFNNACLNGNGYTIYGLYSENNSLFRTIYNTDLQNINFSCFYMKNTPLIAEVSTGGNITDIKIDKGEVVFKNRTYDKNSGRDNGGIFDEISDSLDNKTQLKNVSVDINMSSDNAVAIGLFTGFSFLKATNQMVNVNTKGSLKVSIKKPEDDDRTCAIGGVAGMSYGGLKNCSNRADITVDLPAEDKVFVHAGGLIGSATNSSTENLTSRKIEKCTNYGDIKVTTKYNEKVAEKLKALRQNGYYAGIISEMYEGNIINCVNKGDITADFQYNVAGIVNDARENINITNCLNQGKLTSDSCYSIAGIVNVFQGKISHCENQGDIFSTEKLVDKYKFFCSMTVAGIAGNIQTTTMSSSITWCKNTGHIKADDEALWATTSGIAGSISQSSDKKYANVLSNCLNTGIIEGCMVSGIVNGSGANETSDAKCRNLIKNCVNAGKLIHNYADDRVAGIVFSTIYTDIVNCANLGSIVKTVKNPFGDLREAQIVSLNNEGAVVKNCYILTSNECKWPGTAINQLGGKTEKTNVMTASQIKNLKFVKKVMKKSGIKKK